MRVAGGIGLGMVVFVSVLAFAAVGRILAPLSTLGGTARSIESGDDLTRRIEVRGNDDIAELGHLFNAMLDRLEQAFALQREFVSDAGPRAAHADHDHPRPPAAARPRPRDLPDRVRRAGPHEPVRGGPADAREVRAPRLPHAVGAGPGPADGGADGEGEAARAARVAAGGDRRRAAARGPAAAHAGDHEPRPQRRPAHRGGRCDHARLLPRRLAGADLGRGRRAGRARGGPRAHLRAVRGRGDRPGAGDRPDDRARARRPRRAGEQRRRASSRSCCRRHELPDPDRRGRAQPRRVPREGPARRGLRDDGGQRRADARSRWRATRTSS